MRRFAVIVAEETVPQDVVESEAEFAGPAGRLFRRGVHPPAGRPPWARLAVLHGYGDHSGRYREFMAWMARRGVACEALDLRGHGQSAGRRGAVGTWKEYLDDLDALLEQLESERPSSSNASTSNEQRAHTPTPLFLLGHSHGGLIVAAAGERSLPGVAGVVLTAPFLRSRLHIPRSKLLFGRFANWVAPSLFMPNGLRNEWMSSDAEKVAESAGDPLLVRTATPRWYFGTLAAQREVMRAAERFTLPLLILAGDADPVADHRATYDFIHEAGSEDKSLQILHEQLHELLREKDREETFAFIHEWISDRSSAAR